MLLSSATEPIAAAMIGDTYTPLDNGYGMVGVGDDNTAAAKAQTDLQSASNKAYLPMDPGYPFHVGSVVTFEITAGGSDANYIWREFLLCTGSPGIAWVRFVDELNGGAPKIAGDIWTLQIEVTVGRNDAAN